MMKKVELVVYTPEATVESLTETLQNLMLSVKGIKDASIASVTRTVSGNNDFYIKKEDVPYWSADQIEKKPLVYLVIEEVSAYETGFRVLLVWEERLF